MANSYSILDQVNPFLIYLETKGNIEILEKNSSPLLKDEYLFEVAQVIVWMLVEYYSDSWAIPIAEQRRDLFGGLIIFFNHHAKHLIKTNPNLLRDI